MAHLVPLPAPSPLPPSSPSQLCFIIGPFTCEPQCPGPHGCLAFDHERAVVRRRGPGPRSIPVGTWTSSHHSRPLWAASPGWRPALTWGTCAGCHSASPTPCQAEPSSFCPAPDTFRPRSQRSQNKGVYLPRALLLSAGLRGPALDSIRSQAQMTEAEFRALLDGSWDRSVPSCTPCCS